MTPATQIAAWHEPEAHTAQVLPEDPQAVGEAPLWQTPFVSQQPVAQVAAPQGFGQPVNTTANKARAQSESY